MSKVTKDRAKSSIDREQLDELLYQALETEIGGVDVYRTALRCAQHRELRSEWEKYLGQTEQHVVRLREVCTAFGLDPETDTPGRQVVRFTGKALVQTMCLALGGDDPAAAERVAAACVVHAETTDHLHWSLLGEAVKQLSGSEAELLARAYSEIEDEEDEHLYHSQGWVRELWLRSLKLPAVLPPPEEKQDVRSAIAAAKAQASRGRDAEAELEE